MENSILQKVKDTEKLFEGYEIIGNELARVTALREKLEQQHMTVSVMGDLKGGKGGLETGRRGGDILLVDEVPVTAVVTTVDYGDEEAPCADHAVRPGCFCHGIPYVSEGLQRRVL